MRRYPNHFCLPVSHALWCLIAAGAFAGEVRISDDEPPVITLEGDFYRTQYFPRNPADGTTFNAWDARWVVDNCGWTGDRISYPVRIGTMNNGEWNGGLFVGQIPPDAEREYCNSAALLVGRQVDGFRVRNVRIDSAWDGIRFATRNQKEGVAIVEGAWISRSHDDAIDIPRMLGLTVRDSLLEGFVGVSVDPGARYGGPDLSDSEYVTKLDGVLMRVSRAFIKGHRAMPPLEIRDCIFAFDKMTTGMRNRTRQAWAKTRVSENNELLWLSDEPFPENFPKPPDGFTIYTGEEARERWETARLDWIARHPDVPRLPGDPEFGRSGE